MRAGAAAANALGVLALLFWSMSVSVTRHLGEAHPFGMPGLSYATAGVLLIALDAVRGRPLPWRSDADGKFWLWGGGSFVVYLLVYTTGLSWSDSRMIVLPLGLVNYFWPSLILLLMPFFFSCSVRWRVLGAGAVLCIAGAAAAMLWGMAPAEMAELVGRNWPAFLLVLMAAFLWAFYSNAARKWGGSANGTGWFMLAGGLCFLTAWFFSGEPIGFHRDMIAPFLLHACLVNATAYLFWDIGVRRGDIGLMGTLANFLPIGSIAFGCWYLGDVATPGLWPGCLLVTAGAVLCRRALASERDSRRGGNSRRTVGITRKIS